MKRRAFALYNLGLFIVAGFAFVAGVAVLRLVAAGAGLNPGDPGFNALATTGAALFAGTLLWAVMAMAVKRSRDSGLSKGVVGAVAGGLPGVPFLDHMILAPITPDTMAWPMDSFTPVALVGLVGIYLYLLLSPSTPIAPLLREGEETSVPETDGVYA